MTLFAVMWCFAMIMAKHHITANNVIYCNKNSVISNVVAKIGKHRCRWTANVSDIMPIGFMCQTNQNCCIA